MQGSKFLKVTGILMIVFGSLAIILAIIALAGLGLLEALGAPMGILWASGILAMVSAVAELVAGIIGVKNCKNPEKATSCIIWGIIIIALSVVSNVLTLIGYPENFSVISLLTGLVIPVLYLIGAFMNKKTIAQ